MVDKTIFRRESCPLLRVARILYEMLISTGSCGTFVFLLWPWKHGWRGQCTQQGDLRL